MGGLKGKHNSFDNRQNSSSKYSISPLKLLHKSFSHEKVSRKSPLIGGFHRAIDGALLGVLVSVGLLSALTMHWQYLWTSAFTRLELTRELSNELTETNAVFERYLLENANLPLSMVPTKAENLLYLERPYLIHQRKHQKESFVSVIKSLMELSFDQGY